MTMEIAQNMSQRQTQWEVTQLMADSIFPDVAKMLSKDAYIDALHHVAGRKRVSRYRSGVDFLFFELFPKYRPWCRRFYKGRGPQLNLVPDVTPDQILRWQAFMKGALLVAHALLTQKQRASWGLFRQLLEASAEPDNSP